jgi:acetyltransferase-like isoleucine patch superfamily enzyme
MREFIVWLASKIPGRNGISFSLRRQLYKLAFKKCGRCKIYENLRVWNPQNFSIGNSFINDDVWIDAWGEVEIGDDVLIGARVIIHSAEHYYEQPRMPIWRQGHWFGKVKIEDNVWIGAGAIILPEVTIGSGSVVAAGALVRQDVSPFSVVAGVPASVVRRRELL